MIDLKKKICYNWFHFKKILKIAFVLNTHIQKNHVLDILLDTDL